MPSKLLKHGTNEGYKAELDRHEKPCHRCTLAHRVHARQYTKAGRAAGLKYGGHDVIDHLYETGPGQTRRGGYPGASRNTARVQTPVGPPAPDPYVHTDPGETGPEGTPPGPSWGDKLADRIKGLRVGSDDNEQPYVAEEFDDFTVNLTPIDPDPDPEGDTWEPAGPDEYMINAAGLKLIEDNLGTYLSVVGITVQMIDPVCGPVLAENFENIVSKWTKVISRYPSAAKLFMSEDGGTIFTWIGALQATWPVLLMFYKHHLAKSVTRDPMTGEMFNRRQTTANGTQNFDPLVPPMAGGNSGYAYTTG